MEPSGDETLDRGRCNGFIDDEGSGKRHSWLGTTDDGNSGQGDGGKEPAEGSKPKIDASGVGKPRRSSHKELPPSADACCFEGASYFLVLDDVAFLSPHRLRSCRDIFYEEKTYIRRRNGTKKMHEKIDRRMNPCVVGKPPETMDCSSRNSFKSFVPS